MADYWLTTTTYTVGSKKISFVFLQQRWQMLIFNIFCAV